MGALSQEQRWAGEGSGGPHPTASNRTTHEIRANPEIFCWWSWTPWWRWGG